MKRYNLSLMQWELLGWRPNYWKLGNCVETGSSFYPEVHLKNVDVPGSVQKSLLKSGIIKDWNLGVNSRDCQWIEHLHWEFRTFIEVDDSCNEIILQTQGLTGPGWIMVNNKYVGVFESGLANYSFDISKEIKGNTKNSLRIIFDIPPEQQGQIGYTSKTEHFVPRYNYSWDWCPRFIPIGIWDSINLIINPSPVEIIKLFTSLGSNNSTGIISVDLNSKENCRLNVVISEGSKVLAESEHELTIGSNKVNLSVNNILPWWPNGMGEQKLYNLRMQVDSELIKEVNIGFKRVQWLKCPNVPDNLPSWICSVNGKEVFLQGVNWTPIKLDYASIDENDYFQRAKLYKDMGCNIIRIWGGAYLEKEVLYKLCDELGLFIWQDFPLSSSGIENTPFDDEKTIEKFLKIAQTYLRRRHSHVSLLIWCGGNELAKESSDGNYLVPCSIEHPVLKRLSGLVNDFYEENEQIKFVPTSPSGPRFLAEKGNFGKNVHYDVHGPWNLESDIDNWQDYWQNDDALFRSEVGTPGAQSYELTSDCKGNCSLMPASEANEYWKHSSCWWMQWGFFKGQIDFTDEKMLKAYVEESQNLQARALSIAVKSCKERFPKCGGIIVWMGHDCFPCPVNTSLIDFSCRPKKAYFAIKEIFKSALHPETCSIQNMKKC